MATVLTNQGEEWLVDRAVGTAVDDAEWIGWGTGNGTAAKSDTTLFTEASEDREQATVTREGTGASAVLQAVATMVSESTQEITNAGLFTASTSGTLVVKGDFSGIALAEDDAIEFTFTLDPS